ncbi:MAG: YdeI/OmpD-associated family protein [Chitinophagaceae bacterium]|nr:YdeI/OmpD-associated family protein [Chitinophagaceae bacterium]
MIRFTTAILKFKEQGEKTGWSSILIPAKIAQQLNPGVKKSFRVKGKFDKYTFDGMSLLPMGDGDFIIPLKADVHKATGKKAGGQLDVQLAFQPNAYQLDHEFMDCLNDEPRALEFFNSLTGSHRNYFSKWIESAKTSETKAKRIALAVNALANKWDYGQMIRSATQKRKEMRS